MGSLPALNQEPVAYQSGLLVMLNLLIAFHLVHFTVDQVAALNTAYVFFTTYLVRRSVTPIANPKSDQGVPLVPSQSS